MSTIGPARLSGFFADFERRSSGVEIAVHDGSPEGLAAQLSNDELDLAILNPLEGLGDNFHAEPLYTERYVVMLPPKHPLRERNSIALRDLSEQPYVDRLSCEMRELVMGVCENMGVKLYARFRSEREDWVQGMVMANIGFAFMPEYSIVFPDCVQRPLIEPPVSRTISLITAPGRKHSPAVSGFVRALRAYRWPVARGALGRITPRFKSGLEESRRPALASSAPAKRVVVVRAPLAVLRFKKGSSPKRSPLISSAKNQRRIHA
jgi:DNA-binding transcriptional LysR family regulator